MSNTKKMRLIKKYAKIRLNRLWKANKEDIEILASVFGLFAIMYSSYLLVCVFL